MSDQDEMQPQVTPRSSLGSGVLSYSSSSISPSTTSSSTTGSQGSAKTAVSECLGAWLNYLQIMNNMCAAGYRLAQTIAALEHWANMDPPNQPPGQSHLSFQFLSPWDDLTKASVVATNTVKSHIVSVLQDFITQPMNSYDQECEIQRAKDHNQFILLDNAQTMINLQHQFCVASIESFSALMCCYQCQTQVGFPHEPDCMFQRSISPHFGMKMQDRMYERTSISTQGSSDHGTAFEQPHDIRDIRSSPQGFLDNIRGPLPNPGNLLGMKAPFYRGSKSPLNYPLFPLNGQRRWSEAAANEVNSEVLDAESQMRRWSMPWEATKTDKTVNFNQARIMPISKLAVPPNILPAKSSGDRSQSTTPESTWHSSITSQDGLVEAIQLLSCRPVHKQLPQMSTNVIGQSFPEESSTPLFNLPSSVNFSYNNNSFQQQPQPSSNLYGLWQPQNNTTPMNNRQQDRMSNPPFMKYIREQEGSFDENLPP